MIAVAESGAASFKGGIELSATTKRLSPDPVHSDGQSNLTSVPFSLRVLVSFNTCIRQWLNDALAVHRQALAFPAFAAGARRLRDICLATAVLGTHAMDGMARPRPESFCLFGRADPGARHQLRSCRQRPRLPAIWRIAGVCAAPSQARPDGRSDCDVARVPACRPYRGRAELSADAYSIESRFADQHGRCHVGGADRSTVRIEPNRPRPISRLAPALVRTRRVAIAAFDRGLARCTDLSRADVVRQRRCP